MTVGGYFVIFWCLIGVGMTIAAGGTESLGYTAIAVIFVAFMEWVTIPEKVTVNHKGFYSITRFGEARLMAHFDRITGYTIKPNGTFRLMVKNNNGKTVYTRISGKFRPEDLDKMNRMMATKKIKSMDLK